jgi:hypothetical protein
MSEYLSPQGASLLSLLLNADLSALPDDYVQKALGKLNPEEGKQVAADVYKTSKGRRKKSAGTLQKWADQRLVGSE